MTTSSFDSNPGNNTARVWSYNHHDGTTSVRQVAGNYTVNVSADNAVPSPGGTVNFTITTNRENPYDEGTDDQSVPPPIDLKVDIELTEGLSVSGTPTYASGQLGTTDVPDSVSYSNGVFTIGTMNTGKPRRNAVTLPVSVASTAVVDEQCLTARLTGNPPPGTVPLDDDISDNVAQLCLGDPVEPFSSGQVDAFTVYPCVGVTDAPCDNADDIRVRAVHDAYGAPLTSGAAVFWIDPLKARIYDSNTGHSVNDGNTVSWQTAVSAGRPYTDGLTSGVELYYSRAPYEGNTSGWGGVTLGIAARDADGNTPPPGKVFVRSTSNGNAVRKAESPNYEQLPTAPTGNSPGTSKVNIFLEFEKMGTYKFTWHAAAKRSTLHGSEDCLPNSADPPVNQVFCTTETYTFHVGPMADLAVEDGGASHHAASDQHGLTVIPVNNGPDNAGSAQVTGLPTGAQVIHISQGAYDDTTGEWDIGELKVRGYYRSRGEPDPTLILSASAEDAGNVSIANSENYEVCIGPSSNPMNLAHTTQAACEAVTNASWNSTPVYDYNADNDTATLMARAGSPPTHGARAQAHPAAVTVEWDPVETLYGWPVSHYEVESSSSSTGPWMSLAKDVAHTRYVDTQVQPGDTRYYRVRAVNEAEVEGPWSEPMPGMAEPQATAGAPDQTVLTATPASRTRIDLEWEKPIENGSPIVSYTLEVSESRNGPWAAPVPAPQLGPNATGWSHTGLTEGATRHYRLRATNMCGNPTPASECHSPWSEPVSGKTWDPGQAGPPIGLSAAPDGDSAIDISWSAPLDDGGSPIAHYEVQWSPDGTGNWRSAGRTPDAEIRTFKQGGMTFGTTRYYRVAARNGVALGQWSDPPVSATTLAGVPGMPNLTARAADANTIALTWTVPADNGSPIVLFQLEWSADGSDGSWARLANPSASDTSYSDGGLDPGTERHYRIRAVNGATPGEGSWSTVRNATTPPAVPDAPILRAEVNGQNAIDVIWDPPFDDGGADITGYELQWSADGAENSYSRLTSPSASARSYTHSGLQPGTTRHYQLRARNRAGWGEWSFPASAVTLTGVPAAPNLTVRANGASEIKLSWTKPDDRGSDIFGYHLQQSDDGNDWHFLGGTIPASDTEYVHDGLSGGTTKHYRVRALNNNGDGQWSQSRSARTDAGGPDAPVLTLSALSDNQIDLGWTVPADNGSSIRGYWVERSVDGNEPWERLTSNNRTTTYSDDDLYRGMTRYYRVAAFNGGAPVRIPMRSPPRPPAIRRRPRRLPHSCVSAT